MKSMAMIPEGDAAAEQAADRTLVRVAWSIAACALVLAVATLATRGSRMALGVVVGGAIAVANFVLLARIGKALTGSGAGAAFWGGMYFIKIAALFGGLYLLFHSGMVDGYGILVGLCALVPGIVVGGVLTGAPAKAP